MITNNSVVEIRNLILNQESRTIKLNFAQSGGETILRSISKKSKLSISMGQLFKIL